MDKCEVLSLSAGEGSNVTPPTHVSRVRRANALNGTRLTYETRVFFTATRVGAIGRASRSLNARRRSQTRVAVKKSRVRPTQTRVG